MPSASRTGSSGDGPRSPSANDRRTHDPHGGARGRHGEGPRLLRGDQGLPLHLRPPVRGGLGLHRERRMAPAPAARPHRGRRGPRPDIRHGLQPLGRCPDRPREPPHARARGARRPPRPEHHARRRGALRPGVRRHLRGHQPARLRPVPRRPRRDPRLLLHEAVHVALPRGAGARARALAHGRLGGCPRRGRRPPRPPRPRRPPLDRRLRHPLRLPGHRLRRPERAPLHPRALRQPEGPPALESSPRRGGHPPRGGRRDRRAPLALCPGGRLRGGPPRPGALRGQPGGPLPRRHGLLHPERPREPRVYGLGDHRHRDIIRGWSAGSRYRAGPGAGPFPRAMQTQPSLTLDRYLSERGPMDPVQAAKIAIQVARQLSQAGDALLVHPGRILVGKDGSVRLLPPPAEDLALPAIVEFPAYASPEEARGGHPDLRSGLYSLGCTLHELLTGRPPYSAADPKQILKAHLESPIPDLRKLSPKAPASLAEIVKELLAKDPEERVQTPDELVRRLRQSIGVPAGTAPQAPAATAPRAASPTATAAAAPAPRRGQPRAGSK